MSSVFSLIHKQPTINYLAWLCINPHHHLTPTPLPPGHNHTGARLSSRHAHKILKTCGIVRVSEWQWLMGNKLERKIKFTFNCLVSLNQTSWHFFEALFKNVDMIYVTIWTDLMSAPQWASLSWLLFSAASSRASSGDRGATAAGGRFWR